MPRALIVGAGIGGLAAGIALRRVGWEVRIFERAPVPREIGFGVGLAPNAAAALRELGLDDAVRRAIVPLRGEIRHADGRVIRRLKADPGRFRDAQLLRMIQRPVLHGALLDAVGPPLVEGNHQAVSFESDARSVTVRFADGSSARGDILLGADGFNSAIRAQLHPGEPPATASGYFALRGMSTAVGALGGHQGLWYFGHRLEAGAVQSGPDTVYWFTSFFADDVRAAGGDVVRLRQHLVSRMDRQFGEIAGVSSIEQMRLDELFERPALAQWGEGRVTLLGDAAHPVLPHTGQGAAQALEDAVGLGRAMASSQDQAVALRRYEHVRGRRTRAIVRSGPRIARITTARSALTAAVRNTAIRLFPATVVTLLLLRPASDPNRRLGPPLPER